MPAQTNAPEVIHYVEFDTAPSLRAQIVDRNGNGIPLVNASQVTIRIAPSRWDYDESPIYPIIDDASCVIDPDQVNFPGFVDWYPQPNDLTPAGPYRYTFRVTWVDGTQQTFPQHVQMSLVIRSRTGGNT